MFGVRDMVAFEDIHDESYPILHIVVDHRRKKYVVLLETSDGEFIYIPADKIKKVYGKLKELEGKAYKEATGDQVDIIVEEALDLERIEYIEE